MSIATEVQRISAAKASLKTAINNKGGALTTEKLDSYAAAVSALPVGSGGVDVSDTTATSAHVLSTVVFHDSTGALISGNISIIAQQPAPQITVTNDGVVSAYYVPAAGFSEDNTLKETTQQLTIAAQPDPSINIDTDGLITAAYTPVSGFVTDVSQKSNTLQLTVVTQPNPALAIDNNGLISAVYTPVSGLVKDVSVKSATLQLTTKAAATIVPGTTDNVELVSGTYLTGLQTIKGDPALLGNNIVSGVTIFNVAGTHKCTGGTDVSDTTALAEDVLYGRVFHTSTGAVTTGTIQTVTQSAPILSVSEDGVIVAENIPISGYTSDTTTLVKTSMLALDATKILAGQVMYGTQGTATNDADAVASNILSGKKAYVSGSLVVGNMQTVTQPNPTLSMDEGTITAKYTPSSGAVTDTSEKSATIQLPTQEAQTIIPGTTDNITLSSGTYLTGLQTIKGDPNLVGSNIVSGVTIFEVAGTHECSGGEETIVAGYFINTDGVVTFHPVGSSSSGSDETVSSAYIVNTGVAEPEYEGGGSTSVFDLIKCTAYTPGSSYTAVTVSGVGTIVGTDYSEVNGNYVVTEETKSLSDAEKVYKHTEKDYYMYFFDDSYGEGFLYYCCIATVSGTEHKSSILYKFLGEDTSIPTGVNTWIHWYNEEPVEISNITTAIETITEPGTTKGVKVTGYDVTAKTWDVDTTEKEFSSFENTPVVNCVYAAKDTALIGSSIATIS